MRIAPSNHKALPSLTELFPASTAANDPCRSRTPEGADTSIEINEMLIRVCEHVASNTRPSLPVLLTPLDSTLNIHEDGDTFAFIVSGLLTVSHRDRNTDPSTRLRLSAARTPHELILRVQGDRELSASVVKAIQSNGGDGDPTIAHCKRLVEGAGGRLQIVRDLESPGVSLHLPIERTACDDNAASATKTSNRATPAVLAS